MPLQIASNDDSGSSQLSKLTFEALPDTDYYVSVEGYSTFCGEVDVRFVAVNVTGKGKTVLGLELYPNFHVKAEWLALALASS